MKDYELLKKLTVFSGLPDEALEKIAEISVEHRYKKNMMVFMEGERGEAFYYIKSGKVKIYRTYEDGREHIVHILSEGDVFGEATLFSEIAYPASAAVYEDSTIGAIVNSDLEKLISQSPGLSLKIIKVLASKLVQAQHKIRDLTYNDVFSRTASQLLRLAGDHGLQTDKGTMINIPLSRQELADMAGTTRETVSRILSKFRKEKSIAEQDDRIIILNSEKLKSWQ
ncbi:MAG: cAMP-binding protein [Clostridiales bacterium GWC2_40_7]|nr:MAG: cAMP-binding protein [Clostridiales bacterium GWC2_40_7]